MNYVDFVAWARGSGWSIDDATLSGSTDVVVGTRDGRIIEWERGLDAVWRIRKDRRVRKLPS